MVFASSPGSSEDGLLNTYEVYNVPLKARMVVLSSCNTGSGKITSGEGIQSLARGFISSGGKSVIMSMWEVEDYAGSEVIKLFYKNIIRGNTKSQALRKARLSFLRNADQQRSHPYYWSTLVVYGDDAPLYYSKTRLASAIISLCVVLSFLIFIFYRDIRS
jgi:CHAT domain-containing protein